MNTAFLIGINSYKIPGADLRGCVNDVNNLKAALLKHFSFQEKNIKILTDLKATKQAMQDGITRVRKGRQARRRAAHPLLRTRLERSRRQWR